MHYPVIVKATANSHYQAEPMGIPELRTTAPTEEAALEKVTQVLGKWLGSAKVVQVEIEIEHNTNPWLEAFGRSADDPDFDDFIIEMNRARVETLSR